MVKVIGAVTVLVDRMGDAPMCRSATTGHWIAVEGGRDADVHAVSSSLVTRLVAPPSADRADPCVEHRRKSAPSGGRNLTRKRGRNWKRFDKSVSVTSRPATNAGGRASNAARKLLDAGVDVTHKAAHIYPPGSMSCK
jgi:hypothetical protein